MDPSSWYKDAVFYELRVRSFYDSNGDGIGDFRGLTQKLDYLQDLGITTLWLLPFYRSPLRDDGYDISDYTAIHPECGTLADFKSFLKEAHKRGIQVVTELVLNHTSDQHQWFKRAREARVGSAARDFYIWSDTPEKFKDARIIFKDFESSNWAWDPVSKVYYWHRFYSHQPDLNYDSPAVRRGIFKVVDFWLGMGVDGLRLDAVPYLFKREGTNCENLPETHAFLRDLRRHVDRSFPRRMLLAEANQWPEDAKAYFGDGDECHMAFHFPMMPRMFMALSMEDRYPLTDILEQTPSIPDACQWALFLRNHDELTLEMVTDEERDYMYRAYAQDAQMRINLGIRRRLAPLMRNNRKRIELMNALLFSMPGTPVIYYGDELGMGDNFYLGDRNGVRTPMQWSADRNAGFSRSNPHQLFLPVIMDPEYHYEAVNVEVQQKNPHSLLWWMKRLIALRKRTTAFGRGSIAFLYPKNRRILAFTRAYGEETILVVANLSRFVQYTELELSEFKGRVPVEMLGQTPFPPVGSAPYFLTLGPHSFYWFSLEPEKISATAASLSPAPLAVIETELNWENLLQGRSRPLLAEVLPRHIRTRRWFGGKGRRIKACDIQEAVCLARDPRPFYLVFIRVEYLDGNPETYVIPLSFCRNEEWENLKKDFETYAIAKLDSGVIFDASADGNFSRSLFSAIATRRQARGSVGKVFAAPSPAFKRFFDPADLSIEPSLLKGEQSNTSFVYGNRWILKLLRRVEPGVNPDLEIGRFLTERTSFDGSPAVCGFMEYRGTENAVLAILQQFIPNGGDAWQYTLDEVEHYLERVTVHLGESQQTPRVHQKFLNVSPSGAALKNDALIGTYLESARLLGQRTAQLHAALASDGRDPSFSPEPFSTLYQRSLYQSMRNLVSWVMQLAGDRVGQIEPPDRKEVERIIRLEKKILQFFQTALTSRKISCTRIRCHGDYHLGQLLYTGNDFVILDFEGEPARPLSERRTKRSPLRDVAGMLRSFNYAAYTAFLRHLERGLVPPERVPVMESWTEYWYTRVSEAFLRGYLTQASKASYLPDTKEELEILIKTYLLEKALYELGYEINARPDRIRIPALGILKLVEG